MLTSSLVSLLDSDFEHPVLAASANTGTNIPMRENSFMMLTIRTETSIGNTTLAVSFKCNFRFANCVESRGLAAKGFLPFP